MRAMRLCSITTAKKEKVSDDTEACDCDEMHSNGVVQACLNIYTYSAIRGAAGFREGFSISCLGFLGLT